MEDCELSFLQTERLGKGTARLVFFLLPKHERLVSLNGKINSFGGSNSMKLEKSKSYKGYITPHNTI